MAKTEKRQPQKDFEAARGERQLRRLIGWAASEDAVEIHRALLELRECRAEIGWHRIAVKSLALSLFPDSPLNSAIAEFDLDAMGACQVIRRLRADLAEAIRTRNLAQEASTRDLEAKRAAEGERDRLGLSYCVLEGQYETACQIITEERKELERLKADAEANEELICFILSSNKPWTGTLPKLEFAKNEIEIANAVARYQKGISRESQNKIEAHVEILKNLANALFPDSPLDSALAEFALDAMGACQVIRRLRADKKRLDWCERMARKYPGEVVNVIGAVIGANMRERIDAAMGGE
jgi:hypothetical protein